MSIPSAPRGLSMVDVVVGSALVLVIFLSLITLLQASLLVASLAKAKAGASAVANTQMEYIRSLPYDSVGTLGGIPAGIIPANATTTENGISYGVRTFIEYVDDPADGVGAADTNAITTDYKRIKIAVTYNVHAKPREVDLVSSYTPASIETTTNGGTLKIQVVDQNGAAVAGATVRVVNATTTPTVDLTTFSDASGVVLLGGAATSTEYQVYISKNGYSSAQTYLRDLVNVNPTPGYITIVKNTTTTSTFVIDLLSSLRLRTLYPIQATSTVDTFSNASNLAVQSNTAVSGGSLHLYQDASGYALSGTARSTSVTPAYLSQWTTASTTLFIINGTSALVHVTDGGGTLIPDTALPGNSIGFSSSSIDLSGISTTTYPSLALMAELSTGATTTSPSINSWSLNALVGPIPVPNVLFTLGGAKTIGSTGASAPIYKTNISTSTDTSGALVQTLESDLYTLGVPGYDVVDACVPPPYGLSPGSSYSSALYLGPSSTNEILVTVRDSSGLTVTGANVELSRSGYDEETLTSSCGNAYFGALTSGTYTVTISKSGYTTTSASSVSVSGHGFYSISFP